MADSKRTDWFMKDRFGMFIHWGIYSIPARGEWVRSAERITIEDYQKYFDAFDPIDYNPEEWAKLAKEAGMKYAVLTTKHHDGFCLFESKFTDYNAPNTKAGRDLVREYVDAFRAQGIKIGFYYSLLDWHHPDYPAYKDWAHPMRDNEAFNGIEQDFSRYVEYFHGQVRELLTNYGKIDIMWFDFSYKDSVNDMSGEKWQADRLHKMIRELQPDIILDNRLTRAGETENYNMEYGDFASPEQVIPSKGVVDKDGECIPWEACITLNNNWGYCEADHDYKQAKDVIHALVECTSKNGNMILNVGPDAKGNIPEESVAILKQVGKWMKKNSDSIYSCRAADLPKPEWGRYTRNGDTLYAHIYDRGIGAVNIEGLSESIKEACYLYDKSEIGIATPWYATGNKTGSFLNLKTYKLPDEIDTVVEIKLK
ncbi:MAG: alpha-L-fucosidase [Saccharofermentanales bacterium]